jgi:hypothetical protein
MNRSLAYGERVDSSMVATQSSQQPTIDDLYVKIAELTRGFSRQQ